MVDVILLERIERLGQMGDVVSVRPGYARNFLLPQKKAMRATKDNMKQFEDRKAQLVADNLKRRDEASAVAAKMGGLAVTLVRQAGESGQLYGSVTARDLADAVTEAGFSIGKGQVIIDRPIKTTGLHQVRISLHPEVAVEVKVGVAPSAEEAKVALGAAEPAADSAEADEGGEPAAE